MWNLKEMFNSLTSSFLLRLYVKVLSLVLIGIFLLFQCPCPKSLHPTCTTCLSEKGTSLGSKSKVEMLSMYYCKFSIPIWKLFIWCIKPTSCFGGLNIGCGGTLKENFNVARSSSFASPWIISECNCFKLCRWRANVWISNLCKLRPAVNKNIKLPCSVLWKLFGNKLNYYKR